MTSGEAKGAGIRQSYPQISKATAEELLQSLLNLAGHATSPENSNGETEKDMRSFRALQLAGQLIGPLVRWAINHETGKILGKVRPAVNWLPHRIENWKKYEARTLKRNLLANSHDNEQRGAAYAGDDPLTNRQIAGAIVALISRGMDFDPGRRLAGALEALDQGEVLEMLEPARKGQRFPFSLGRIRLGAAQHVHFRHGKGMTMEAATNEVANALAISSETLNMWVKRLRRQLDLEEVDEHLERSRAAGRLARALEDPSRRWELAYEFHIHVDFQNPRDLEEAAARVEKYSPAELTKLAARFKELSRRPLRRSPQKSRRNKRGRVARKKSGRK